MLSGTLISAAGARCRFTVPVLSCPGACEVACTERAIEEALTGCPQLRLASWVGVNELLRQSIHQTRRARWEGVVEPMYTSECVFVRWKWETGHISYIRPRRVDVREENGEWSICTLMTRFKASWHSYDVFPSRWVMFGHSFKKWWLLLLLLLPPLLPFFFTCWYLLFPLPQSSPKPL